MIEILKSEILRIISYEEGRAAWNKNINSHKTHDSRIDLEDVVKVLDAKYRNEKWLILLSAALAELEKDGYSNLLRNNGLTWKKGK